MGDAIDRDDVLAFINSDHEMSLNELRDGIRALPAAPPAASEVATWRLYVCPHSDERGCHLSLMFSNGQCFELARAEDDDDARQHCDFVAEMFTRAMAAIGAPPPSTAAATPPTAPGERGEAVEALLRRANSAEQTVLRVCQALGCVYQADGHADASADEATIIDHIEELSAGEGQQRARAEAAESDRDAIRAQLTEFLNERAVADIFRAMAEKCQACGKLHADADAWAQKPHSIHQCVKDVFGDGCGATWLDRNAKHALRKVAKALSADLLDEETPEQFGERMREVLDLHVGEHALADERATEATSALAELHSEHAGAVAMNRAAEGAIATLETKLTEATARAERAEARGVQLTADVKALREFVDAEVVKPEPAPIGAEWREELGRVASVAFYEREDAWESVGVNRKHWRAVAEAVARRVVERVRGQDAEDAFRVAYEEQPTGTRECDRVRAGLSAVATVALGDLSTGAGNSPTSSDCSHEPVFLPKCPHPEVLGAIREHNGGTFGTGVGERLAVWLADCASVLDGRIAALEKARLRGRR